MRHWARRIRPGGFPGPSLISGLTLTTTRPSSDSSAFKAQLAQAQNIVILTGAGVSAESGIPTFRGPGGLWRTYQATDLATPQAFQRDPSLVWEFYHYRRELMATKAPNPAHRALAQFETQCEGQGRSCRVITQNIDGLHQAAGSQDVLELHGALFRVRCTACGVETANHDSPICPALHGRGQPDAHRSEPPIPVASLPRCVDCGGLLRPAVVWFGENLNPEVFRRAHQAVDECDLCLVVGTSALVYPAALFAPGVAARGAEVAEFNIEPTASTSDYGFYFEGPCGQTLPPLLLG
ncbi:hypothetical protein TCAL_00465 [Tigriopus californicus]|uniref:NAD-dependent protein deacylase n=1 Tax=Tigriopus californicus TaxID=6832 RepID=A0A553NDC1_TIGCA|nr:NAD-dependent protein deacylase-like [Tigriopus californicus]TRY63408.1 hypothetical protein TCAL_00465 [Tigriopus californicus]|eukprot:TCALIF_00465-PA protein Name:"Similar to sirt5 NAD-dependent protein deacylase sirtuin-5, mitochondrial (Danio rerio)" AED:0.26 eAED:0.26 QI:0/-1/0/1/-1/1/1/0/294